MLKANSLGKLQIMSPCPQKKRLQPFRMNDKLSFRNDTSVPLRTFRVYIREYSKRTFKNVIELKCKRHEVVLVKGKSLKRNRLSLKTKFLNLVSNK